MIANLDKASKNTLKEIAMECLRDTMFMAKLLYPEEFEGEMSSEHKTLFDFIDNCKAPKKAIQAFRGLGKTTINKLLVRKKILFGLKHFIGYLSSSSGVAKMVSDSIKTGLTANQRVRKIWGDVRTSLVEGVDEKWAETAWIAFGETLVLPRGAHQQVNGLLWYYYRPDLWIVDDLDDRIEVRSEEQRKKLREWFFGALMPTFSQYKPDEEQEMIYTDTIKHADGLICHLKDDPDWEYLSLSVCDKDYKTNVPEIFSQERLDKIILSHRKRKTMDVFAREYMGMSASEETGSFKTSFWQYYNESDEKFVREIKPRLQNILIYDPAKSRNPASAQSAFLVWGLDLEYHNFYERYAFGDYLTPIEQYEKIFELWDWFDICAVGMEITGLGEHLTYPFKNECLRRGYLRIPPAVITLDARSGKGEFTGAEGGKEGRINSLIPFYQKGLIYHNEKMCGQLETQLLGDRLRDVADCAGYLPQMLEKAQQYFSVPKVYDKDGNELDEYSEFEEMEALERNVFK